MGANAELDIFLQKEDFSLQPLFAVFATENLSVTMWEIRVFDDWHYTNETLLDPGTLDLATSNIFLKKFVLLSFVVNAQWNGTLITSFEDDIINVSFGLDIGDVQKAGKQAQDHFLAQLFTSVIALLNQMNGNKKFQEHFLAASLGVEYSVRFDRDIRKMIQDDNGASIWIVPKEIGKQLSPKKFLKEVKSDITVFTRLPS